MHNTVSDNPTPDPLLERLARSHPLDILMLPFEPGLVTADHYEEALILLYKKRWRFHKIRLVHFAFLTTALGLTFLPLPTRLTSGKLVKRVLAFGAVAASFVWILKEILAFVGYSALFPLFCSVFAGSLAIVHAMVGRSSFSGWHEAYRRLDRGVLNSHYPKRKRRVSAPTA